MRRWGMNRSRSQTGGDDGEIRFAIGQTSLGSVLVAESDHGVVAVALSDDPEVLLSELRGRFPGAVLSRGDEGFERRAAPLFAFIEAPEIGFELPLDVRGTAFQRRVWEALREVPLGQTVSYADLARRIGAPSATRAVAQACGANVLAIVIPCHRVVRSDGAISGYRWGVERKRRLLAREANLARAAAGHAANAAAGQAANAAAGQAADAAHAADAVLQGVAHAGVGADAGTRTADA